MKNLQIFVLGLALGAMIFGCKKAEDPIANPTLEPSPVFRYPQYSLEGEEVETYKRIVKITNAIEVEATITRLKSGRIVEDNGSIHEGEVIIVDIGDDLPAKISVGEEVFIGRLNAHSIPEAKLVPRISPVTFAVLHCSVRGIRAYDACVLEQSPPGTVVEFGCQSVQDEAFEDCLAEIRKFHSSD